MSLELNGGAHELGSGRQMLGPLIRKEIKKGIKDVISKVDTEFNPDEELQKLKEIIQNLSGSHEVLVFPDKAPLVAIAYLTERYRIPLLELSKNMINLLGKHLKDMSSKSEMSRYPKLLTKVQGIIVDHVAQCESNSKSELESLINAEKKSMNLDHPRFRQQRQKLSGLKNEGHSKVKALLKFILCIFFALCLVLLYGINQLVPVFSLFGALIGISFPNFGGTFSGMVLIFIFATYTFTKFEKMVDFLAPHLENLFHHEENDDRIVNFIRIPTRIHNQAEFCLEIAEVIRKKSFCFTY